MYNRLIAISQEAKMFGESGRTVSMSVGRRFIYDIITAGTHIPLVTIQKDMNVADLMGPRQSAEPKPSWCSIFTKSYAMVVAERPEMRRACLTFPWIRMYEYEAATAHVTTEVSIDGEDALAFIPIESADSCPLVEIDRQLEISRKNPRGLRQMAHGLIAARLPRPFRRLAYWFVLNFSGRLRSKYFGTFGVTTVGNWGVESIRPIAPAISILHYGAIEADGKVSIRMTYDHRVLDGIGPSRALNEMEAFLRTEILDELISLNDSPQKPEAQDIAAKQRSKPARAVPTN